MNQKGQLHHRQQKYQVWKLDHPDDRNSSVCTELIKKGEQMDFGFYGVRSIIINLLDLLKKKFWFQTVH